MTYVEIIYNTEELHPKAELFRSWIKFDASANSLESFLVKAFLYDDTIIIIEDDESKQTYKLTKCWQAKKHGSPYCKQAMFPFGLVKEKFE